MQVATAVQMCTRNCSPRLMNGWVKSTASSRSDVMVRSVMARSALWNKQLYSTVHAPHRSTDTYKVHSTHHLIEQFLYHAIPFLCVLVVWAIDVVQLELECVIEPKHQWELMYQFDTKPLKAVVVLQGNAWLAKHSIWIWLQTTQTSMKKRQAVQMLLCQNTVSLGSNMDTENLHALLTQALNTNEWLHSCFGSKYKGCWVRNVSQVIKMKWEVVRT